MPEPVDWPALMRLGLGVLRLPPDAFWSMTPGELRRALEGGGVVPHTGGAMDRGRLAELMAAFPDGQAVARTRAGGAPPEGAAVAGIGPAAAAPDRGGDPAETGHAEDEAR